MVRHNFELAEHSCVVPTQKLVDSKYCPNAIVDERLSKVSLSEKDEKLLATPLGSLLKSSNFKPLSSILKITPLNDSLVISSTNNIGVVNFEQFSVVVKPKIHMNPDNLFGMINYAYDILEWKNIENEFSPKTNDNFLIDMIIYAFVTHCKNIIKYGVYKTYVTNQDNIPYMKGKLLLKQHLQNVLKNRAKFACEYDELEYDNLENQILFFCLDRSYKITKNPILKKQIRMLIFQLSSVISYKHITIHDFKKLNYNRQNSHYENAHELCKLLVKSSGIVDFYSEKTHHVQAFFINMDDIFEKFVAKLFENYYSDRYAVNPQKWKKAWTIDDESTRGIRTDILLKNKKDNTKIVIDTKYTDHLSNNNLYQIGFYIHEYREKDENIQKKGYAILPTKEKIPLDGKKYNVIESTIQKITVIELFINIDQIVSLLNKKDQASKDELRQRVMNLLP